MPANAKQSAKRIKMSEDGVDHTTSAIITVNSNFDSGNGEIVACSDPKDIQIKIRSEQYCERDEVAHFQWFHFRVHGGRGQTLVVSIVNAGDSSFPEAWPGYQACASYDMKFWFRVPTSYDALAGKLVMTLECARLQKYAHALVKVIWWFKIMQDSVYFAYFVPYTYTRHRKLIAGIQDKAHISVKHHILGQSVQGRDIDCLQIGNQVPGLPVIWVFGRQHPGESMAEWFIEGLLEALVDEHSGLAEMMRQKAVVYVVRLSASVVWNVFRGHAQVPNCCPDGSFLGHLRTNAVGQNLNREWDAKPPSQAPEISCLIAKMEETGCDCALDIHGDEEFPTVFVAGAEGVPGYTQGMQYLKDKFVALWTRVSPDFQSGSINKYGVDAPGEADMRMASNWLAQRFQCLSLTLEMPFKDVVGHADPVQGWSSSRCKSFGASMLMPLYDILAELNKAREL